jgi:hypothetical protein
MLTHYPGADSDDQPAPPPVISDLIAPWNELAGLLDELEIERLLEERLPPHRRYLADELHSLLADIGDMMLDAEIDYALKNLELMEDR